MLFDDLEKYFNNSEYLLSQRDTRIKLESDSRVINIDYNSTDKILVYELDRSKTKNRYSFLRFCDSEEEAMEAIRNLAGELNHGEA